MEYAHEHRRHGGWAFGRIMAWLFREERAWVPDSGPELCRLGISGKAAATMRCAAHVRQVFCDRHYGGINYPVGGVGVIPEALTDGGFSRGGQIVEAEAACIPVSSLSNSCA